MCAFRPDFTGLRTNPIKELREEVNYNVASLAKECKITPQVVRDIEKGLPASVSASVVTILASHFPSFSFDVEYMQWKKEKRSLVHLPPVGDLHISDFKTHPFKQYRQKIQVALADLCEWLCLPRFVLTHYEENQRRMPKVLQTEALPQAHMSEIDVKRLANMGEMYFLARERRAIDEHQRKVNLR